MADSGSELKYKTCGPCNRPRPLDDTQIAEYIAQVPDWTLVTDPTHPQKIRKVFRFPTFGDAIVFVMEMAFLAEDEDHHPSYTHNFDEVEVNLTTHAIYGLSENDFIMAAKINAIFNA